MKRWQEFPHLQGRRLLFDTIRRMLSQQVYDVIGATQALLAEHGPGSADDARLCPPLVRFSQSMREDSTALKRFLFKELYRHPQVNETTAKAKQVLSELFAAYVAQPSAMPDGLCAEGRFAPGGGGLHRGDDGPVCGQGA
jgi:dGTPase